MSAAELRQLQSSGPQASPLSPSSSSNSAPGVTGWAAVDTYDSTNRSPSRPPSRTPLPPAAVPTSSATAADDADALRLQLASATEQAAAARRELGAVRSHARASATVAESVGKSAVRVQELQQALEVSSVEMRDRDTRARTEVQLHMALKLEAEREAGLARAALEQEQLRARIVEQVRAAAARQWGVARVLGPPKTTPKLFAQFVPRVI